MKLTDGDYADDLVITGDCLKDVSILSHQQRSLYASTKTTLEQSWHPFYGVLSATLTAI